MLPLLADAAAPSWALFAATLVLVIVTYGIVRSAATQLKDTRRATELSASIDLLREYRSRKMRLARQTVHDLPDWPPDPKGGLNQLEQEEREAVELVSHYLDNLGLFVKRGLLEPHTAAAFLGLSALGMWIKLAPWIYSERQTKPSRWDYQRHFEDVAALFKSMNIGETLLSDLRWLPPLGKPSATE